MIKYLPLLLVCLTGCLVESETYEDYDYDETSEASPGLPGHPGEGPPKDLGCRGEEFEMPDGSIMKLPGLCNPFYIYKGYPDPTEEHTTPHDDLPYQEQEVNNQLEE